MHVEDGINNFEERIENEDAVLGLALSLKVTLSLLERLILNTSNFFINVFYFLHDDITFIRSKSLRC